MVMTVLLYEDPEINDFTVRICYSFLINRFFKVYVSFHCHVVLLLLMQKQQKFFWIQQK